MIPSPYFWFLILFAAVSIVLSFVVRAEGLMSMAFVLVAMVALTCAKGLHALQRRIDLIEKKGEAGPE